jgi:hypothetical protein
MENIENYSKDILDSKDHQEINDFLLELSKSPKKSYFPILNSIIEDFSEELLEKVNINLIYLIGEMGKNFELDNKFIDYVIQTYYKSDRWIRNETIKTLSKISKNKRIMDRVLDILVRALNDNYAKIQLSAFNMLLNETILPKSLLEHVLRNINSSNKEVAEKALDILKKFYMTKEDLYIALNYSENYQLLQKEGIRRILVEYFPSVIELEYFRTKIAESTWEMKIKRIFLNEIDSYLKILLR